MNALDKDNDPKLAILANTVHEIRTPVQTVIGTLELLSDTNLNEEQTEYVRQIEFSSNILLSLINDILDYSKIRSKEFKLENIPFNLIELAGQVSDLISIEAFGKKLEVITNADYSIPKYFMGDPLRIQEILINLLKNAVKFTSSGYVKTDVKKAKFKNGSPALLFEVTDSGIGIDKEKQKNLFTDFYQAEVSTTRKYGGTGLGLSICKDLVTAMNGKIGMRSNPNGGSIFWFAIPMSIPTKEQLEELSIDEKEIADDFSIQHHTHILLVDDNTLALQSLMLKLYSLNLKNVETATNAHDAIKKLEDAAIKNNHFDIAFIDMIMPKVDGWHLAAEINERPELKKLKRYLVVPEGQMGREAKMRLMKWFTGYLYKPIKREKLKTLLNETYDVPTDVEPLENHSVPKLLSNPLIAEDIPILVTEDHPTNRRILVTFLQKYGAIVYEAENGEVAISKINAHPEIAIVFMDIQMPLMDGITATQNLRAKNYKGIIIACTADNSEQDAILYKKNGMNDTLIKPFKRAALAEIIEKWKNKIGNLQKNKKENMMATIQSEENLATENQTKEKNVREKIWNEKDFEETISNDNKLGNELLDEFCSQTKILIADTESAISKNDFQTLRRIGHTLDGSAGTISANVLSECGKVINLHAKKENIEGIKNALELTKKIFSQFEIMSANWKKRHE